MSGSMNRVTLIGNLGADPECKTLSSGKRVANLRMATSEKYKDKSGEWVERTEWHTVVCWGGDDERAGMVGVVEKYLSKGSKVCVEGKLQTRKWQDQSGNDRYSTEVVVQWPDGKLVMLGDGKGGGRRERDDGYNQDRDYEDRRDGRRDPPPRGNGDARKEPGGHSPGSSMGTIIDDDVPFACEWR